MSIFKSWKSGSILVTDAGWGDSGKGKVVSFLIPDYGVKVIGGHNAGHTVVTNKGELGLGLIPSSVIHRSSISVIGQEVVINPLFLIQEIDKINQFGIKISNRNLKIDPRSHLIFPWHEIRDALSEESRGKAAVGSLHLGVGWAYSDRINRRGLRISDILQKDWKDKLLKEFENQLGVIDDMKKLVKRNTGNISSTKVQFNEQDILKIGLLVRRNLRKYLVNTQEIIWKAIDKKAKILFEDSHGAMLDVSHGSWPYTTGVNTGMGGVYRSFGGKAVKSIFKIVVCTKAYQTRVGGGPMPTEDFGKFGTYVREKGSEIGTRSGRARRCGAFDIPIVSYGYNILGLNKNDEVAITKLDVLSGLKKIPVCTSYKQNKTNYKSSPTADAEFLTQVKPKIIFLPGWNSDISNIKSFNKLPKEAKDYVIFLEKQLGKEITLIGVGKHMDSVILK